MSVDDCLKLAPDAARRIVAEIRRQKEADERPDPSSALIDCSGMLTPEARAELLDKIAELVDENYAGRSEMCLQLADLLHRALSHLRFPSRRVIGVAIYYDGNNVEIFRWKHAWVRVGEEVIDGNVDSLGENPRVPKLVQLSPYWGLIAKVLPPAGVYANNAMQSRPRMSTWMKSGGRS